MVSTAPPVVERDWYSAGVTVLSATAETAVREMVETDPPKLEIPLEMSESVAVAVEPAGYTWEVCTSSVVLVVAMRRVRLERPSGRLSNCRRLSTTVAVHEALASAANTSLQAALLTSEMLREVSTCATVRWFCVTVTTASSGTPSVASSASATSGAVEVLVEGSSTEVVIATEAGEAGGAAGGGGGEECPPGGAGRTGGGEGGGGGSEGGAAGGS